MSNELPYLPFFVGDFLVTVATWPADRVGAYALALFYQFEEGGLPAHDEAELARIFHVSKPVARRLWTEIQAKHKFHQRADGLWWNQRLEEVRVEARAKLATATGRGKAGAAARWGKGANGAYTSNAQAVLEQCPGDGIQVKDKESQKEAAASSSTPSVGAPMRASSSPLVVSPKQFEKAQKHYAFYGSRLKVPHILHSELRDKLGGDNPEAALQAWYLTLNAEAEETREPIPDVFPWLRPKFIAWASEAQVTAELERFRPKGA